MRPITLAPALALLALSACVSSPPPAAPAPSPDERLVAECALLAHAGTMMAAAGQPPHEGLTEGCPGVTATDARPMARQLESLRAGSQTPLPAGLIPGTRGEEVFRRLITRGVPVSLAVHLATDPLFAAAAR